MFKKSFYDWCKDTNHLFFLDRWDYDKNVVDPHNISYCDIKTDIYFLCENKKHPSQPHKLSNITDHKKIPKCSICCSFGEWCTENHRTDLLKRWDQDKNNISPFEISMSSTKKMYFKCPKGIHDSELKDLNNIRKQFKSGRCNKCESIGQFMLDKYGDNAIKSFWSDKNEIEPYDINKNSNKRIWIKCQNKKYHPDYDLSAVNFYKGRMCPYCNGKKVCFEDSLGHMYPQCINIWSTKNKTSPYQFMPLSNKQVLWECDNNIHTTYKRSICASVKSNFRCPNCSGLYKESILQEKVRKYIESKYIVNHEYQCNIIATNPYTNYKLPYDNEIVDLNLIIEVNGQQHYKENAYNFFKNKANTPNESLKYRKYLDQIKKDYALNNGYQYLEIPYWTDNKKQTWKSLIDKKIESMEK